MTREKAHDLVLIIATATACFVWYHVIVALSHIAGKL